MGMSSISVFPTTAMLAFSFLISLMKSVIKALFCNYILYNLMYKFNFITGSWVSNMFVNVSHPALGSSEVPTMSKTWYFTNNRNVLFAFNLMVALESAMVLLRYFHTRCYYHYFENSTGHLETRVNPGFDTMLQNIWMTIVKKMN
jgi:hypothetical protein